MKKTTAKNQKPATDTKARNKLQKAFNKTFKTGEKAVDTTPLSQDIPEDYREAFSDELPSRNANTTNWSAPEDRGEDLMEERDPFMQQPERDTQVPPELIQERAYHLYEQRGGNPGDNLADWFEAERQLRGEITSRKKKR